MECNLCNCNFFQVSFDHFFKPYFLNFTANYVECFDDATVAVQLFERWVALSLDQSQTSISCHSLIFKPHDAWKLGIIQRLTWVEMRVNYQSQGI